MLCDKIHRTLKTDFKYAWVWGSCVKHKPGRVGKGHVLQDEDDLIDLTDMENLEEKTDCGDRAERGPAG